MLQSAASPNEISQLRRLMVEHAVTRILATSLSFEESAPEILTALRVNLQATACILWSPDFEAGVLRQFAVASDGSPDVQAFLTASAQFTFARDAGLPGRIWSQREPAWIEETFEDRNFPRAAIAATAGLHSAAGFPIVVGDEFFGVIEIFTTQRLPRDENLLTLMAVVGAEIGQFIRQCRILRENEERLRFTLEAARVGSWDWNIETGQVTWSENLEVIHGRAPGSFGGSVQAVIEEVYPVDRAYVEAAIQQALAGDGDYEVEYRILRSDGTLGWLHGQGRATFDKDGKPVRMAGVCMDVTERRRADETTRLLAEAGAILDGALDVQSTLEGVAKLLVPALGDWCIVDLAGKGHRPQSVALVHSDPAKVELAQAMRRRYPVDPQASHGVANVIRTGQAELYPEIPEELYQALTHDEEHLQLVRGLGLTSAMIVPLTARGRTLGAISLIAAESNRRYNPRDLAVVEELAFRCALALDNARLYNEAWKEVVERRQAEQALREQTQMLAALNRINMILAAELDLEKLVQTVTDAGAELIGAEMGAFFYNVVDDQSDSFLLFALTGIARERFSGMPMPRRTDLFAPTFDGSGVVRVDDVTQDPRYGRVAPYFGLPTGHPSVRSYLAVPVVSRTGEVHGGLFFGHRREGVFSHQDEQVIAGIAAQAAIAIDNARLYQAAQRELTERRHAEEKLREAREAAESANRAKSEFLANMSHEIRTPMTAILGYADVLSRHLVDPDNQQCVETIRRNGQFLLEIINDILDLSRIEAGKLEIERRRFRPDALVAEVCSLMDIRAGEKRLPLSLRYDSPIPETIESDPTRLRQILVNLLGNAIKFTDSGSVQLAVQFLEPEGLLQFAVIDTGVGISREQLDRLFKPFTQADSSVTRRYGGSGLGLAICRRLSEMLGGGIFVQSELGQGSTFTFTIGAGSTEGVLRITPNNRFELESEEDADTDELDCLALVVDDRRDIRYLAQHFLEQAGARVRTAQNGREAVEAVLAAREAGEPFDVIVLDMQMPVLDGYGAASKLRAQGVQTPIIALTAAAMQGDREKCLTAGCDDYTSKPIHGPHLVKLVARYTHHMTPGELLRRRHEMLGGPDLRSEEQQASKTSASPAPRPQEGRRLLLVDDNPDICRLMGMMFELNGHQVRVAHTGGSAVTSAREFLPHAVLLDLGLPDMNGYEVARRFRQMPELEKTLLIALSGRDEPEDRRRTKDAGFHFHVVKPADAQALERLILRETEA